jgi:glutamyl-tRNA reductase
MTSLDHECSPVSASEISEALVSLRECFENVRRSEIQRVRGRLGDLSTDQANAVDSLSHAIIEKMLQAPMAMLKNASAGNEAAFSLETVRRIFDLRKQRIR